MLRKSKSIYLQSSKNQEESEWKHTFICGMSAAIAAHYALYYNITESTSTQSQENQKFQNHQMRLTKYKILKEAILLKKRKPN